VISKSSMRPWQTPDGSGVESLKRKVPGVRPFGESSVLDEADPGREEVSGADADSETARAGKCVKIEPEVSCGRPTALGVAGDKRPAKDSTFPAGVGGE
jgi:hypothetical protein